MCCLCSPRANFPAPEYDQRMECKHLGGNALKHVRDKNQLLRFSQECERS